jgi:hypothetical protein
MKLELKVSLISSSKGVRMVSRRETVSTGLTLSFLFSVKQIFTLIEFLTHICVRQNFFGSY